MSKNAAGRQLLTMAILKCATSQGHPENFHSILGVQDVVTFRTVDPAGADVYHTNVMMAIGTDVAVVCAEAVPDNKQRNHLLERLNRHHKVCILSLYVTVHKV